MIRRQVVVPVSAERLWDALTDPDQVAGWFGARVEWELREGAPARFLGEDGSERLGRVESVRPGRHLRFRWWPVPVVPAAPATGIERHDDASCREAVDPDVSEVSYLLEPHDEGTRLTVQERKVDSPMAMMSAQARAEPPHWSAWDQRLAGAWVTLAAAATTLVRH